MKAWALLVVSSEGQAVTLADQRIWAEQLAAEKGWHLSRVIGEDGEGVGTGKYGPRRVVLSAIADLRALAPDARPEWLLVTRADRLGRGEDIVENQIVLRDLKKLGVRVWARMGGEKKVSTAMEQLFNAMEAAQANQENEVRRDKANAQFDKRRRTNAASVTNNRPYGLMVGKGGSLEVVPGEAAIVQKIFEMRISGAGASVIGKAIAPIAPEALRSSGEKRKRVSRWMPDTITRMLKNRKYCGTIVDEMTWHRAQITPAHIATRHWNNAPIYPWPLAGGIRCFCGAGMYGHPSGPKKIRYYLCSKPFHHAERRRGFHRAERLEAQFWDLLLELQTNPEPVRAESDTSLVDASLRRERAVLADLSRLREDVWQLRAEGHVRAEDVQERLDALAAKRDEAVRRIAELEVQLAVAAVPVLLGPEVLAEAVADWANLTALEQRAVVYAVAQYTGGLWVDAAGLLRHGPIPELLTNAL